VRSIQPWELRLFQPDPTPTRCMLTPKVQVIPSTLIVAIVQYVWIMQTKILSQSKRRTQIFVGMLALVFTWTVMSITLTVKISKSPRWGVIRDEVWPVVACFVLKAFNDVLLTIFLCYHLQRSKNGLRVTDNLIQKVMGYGLRAGLFNCMGSIASMFLLVFVRTNLVYVGVFLVFARLYTICLLAMLNWRRPRRTAQQTELETSESEAIELSTMHWGLSM